MFRQIRPPPPLDRAIDHVWYWRGEPLPHRKELVMASPVIGLLINLDDDVLRHYDGARFEVETSEIEFWFRAPREGATASSGTR